MSACNFFVTCAKGTEGALRRELVALRIHGPRGATGGVSFAGTFMDGMKVCLHARVAMRVLLEVADFRASDAAGLYAETRQVDWTDFVGRGMTIAVSATTQDNPNLRHSGFAALKVKDAVVDMLRERNGRRPDVNPTNPHVAIVLHLRGAEARLFIDLSGEPLHRRGYRVAMVEAPLKESLAAAVLSLGGVAIDKPFIDPMAGSGTLAIEHALAARGVAPGLRRRFGFERWATAEQRRIWETLVKAATDAVRPQAPCPILARDIDKEAIAAARRNAEAAAVLSDITFEVGDIATLTPRGPAGTLCANPPYGERLEAASTGADVERLYASMGRMLDGMRGWRAVFLAGNPIFAKALRRKPTISHRLWNGPIEARLMVFEP
jgi:23S rRNA (guanine2445-N2)-methyltransferase / 23S rRNA (guanine2069-N7)-methyltransferase